MLGFRCNSSSSLSSQKVLTFNKVLDQFQFSSADGPAPEQEVPLVPDSFSSQFDQVWTEDSRWSQQSLD